MKLMLIISITATTLLSLNGCATGQYHQNRSAPPLSDQPDPDQNGAFLIEQFKQYEIPREHHLAAVSYIYSIDNGTLTEDEISSHKQSRPSER